MALSASRSPGGGALTLRSRPWRSSSQGTGGPPWRSSTSNPRKKKQLMLDPTGCPWIQSAPPPPAFLQRKRWFFLPTAVMAPPGTGRRVKGRAQSPFLTPAGRPGRPPAQSSHPASPLQDYTPLPPGGCPHSKARPRASLALTRLPLTPRLPTPLKSSGEPNPLLCGGAIPGPPEGPISCQAARETRKICRP